jgi:hypothetical protein
MSSDRALVPDHRNKLVVEKSQANMKIESNDQDDEIQMNSA